MEREREASFSGGRILREKYCYSIFRLKHFSFLFIYFFDLIFLFFFFDDEKACDSGYMT